MNRFLPLTAAASSHPNTSKPMDISLTTPRQGDQVSLAIRKPAGLRFIGQAHDEAEHHCVLAFFEEATGEPEKDLTLEYPIKETGTGTLHSVTAIALLDGKVLARDRVRIQSGITLPD